MNRRTGLFRLWLIATAAWLIGWTIFVRQRCHPLPDGTLRCEHEPGGWLAFLGEFGTWTHLEIYLLGFVAPALVLALGTSAVWIGRLFLRIKSH